MEERNIMAMNDFGEGGAAIRLERTIPSTSRRTAEPVPGKSRKRCFVIMPFSGTSKRHSQEYWTRFFTDFIKPSVENLGYECERSIARPRHIIRDILTQLAESDIVLAVLTDFNPNVWYELGVRHTLKNGTIMIIEEGNKPPFDIQEYGFIQYQDSISARTDFEEQLRLFIRSIEKGDRTDSPVRNFLEQRSIKQVLAAPSVQYSPLIFESAIALAEQTLLVIGQNLHALTKPRLKEVAFEALRQKPFDLQLLVCDIEPDYLLPATRDFTGPTFIEDLEDSLRNFRQWQEQADAEKENGAMKGRLEIRLSRRIGNLSLTFLDPELDSGMLEITPVPFDTRSAARARFLLTRKEHPEIFHAYWSAYDLIYRTGNSRSIRDLPRR
jgi:hypothetical protein